MTKLPNSQAKVQKSACFEGTIMEIFKIVGVGLLTCVVAIIIRQIRPEMYVVVVLSGSIVMLFMIVDRLSTVFDFFSNIINSAGIKFETFACVLKILGVGYLCEFANSICVDTLNSSIGDKIILAGKVIIVCLSIPILKTLLSTIVQMLPA